MKQIIDYVKKIDASFSVNKNWYAGVTNNPTRRQSEHENEKGIKCAHFKYWICDDEKAARKIEQALQEKGFVIYQNDLKKSLAEAGESKYIYVFKAVRN